MNNEDITYKLIDNNKNQLIKLRKLFANVYGKKSKLVNQQYIDWLYFKNPLGNVLGYNAIYKNQIIGHYACIPNNFVFDSIRSKGLLSLNTATDKNFRRMGLFENLAKLTFKKAKNDGYKFIIGVANSKSTNGFTRKLNFQIVKTLEVKIGIGINKRLNDNNNYFFYNNWSDKSFSWRINNPINKIYQNGQTLTGRMNKGLGLFQAIDYNPCYNPKNINNFSKLNIFNLLKFKVYIGSSKYSQQIFKYYINLPNFLKPEPLNLIFRNLDENHIINLNNKMIENFKISFLDFDII